MELDYHFEDNGRADTLLLLHGFLSDSTSMMEVGDRLSREFNLLYIDLPGFGNTASSGIDYGIEDIGDAIAGVASSLGIRKVDILGYSMGGRVALSLVINHPEFVRRAVLESSSPGIPGAEARNARLAVDRQRAERVQADFHVFIDEWEQLPLFSSQRSLPREVLEQQRVNRLAQNPMEAGDSLLKYGTGIQPSYWSQLDEVALPVLLIVGEEDEKFVEINTKMLAHLPDAKLEVIQGAGHNIHMEAQEKFGTMILDFLIGG